MKSMSNVDVVSMLVGEGLSKVTSNGHIKYKDSITGLCIMLPHKRIISPGTLRNIYKQLKDIRHRRNNIK